MTSRYHCCATCRHFSAEKKDKQMQYKCIRLGFNTRPEYKFDCWDPRKDIQRKMNQQ